MSLLPKDTFWISLEGNIRAAQLKRITDLGCILRVFRNDDDAWDNNPLEDSRFISLEGYQDCFLFCHQDYPVSIHAYLQSDLHVIH